MTDRFKSFQIIADDLSGAADCAAAFARIGASVPLQLGLPCNPLNGEEVTCAVDADTRAMTQAQAIEVTQRAVRNMPAHACRDALVFKKIDSTLRGHVGAELRAALSAAGNFDGLIVAPSFPAQGRTLRGGKLRVAGEDHAHPVDLLQLLKDAGLPSEVLGRSTHADELMREVRQAFARGVQAVIVDAEEDTELRCLAEAIELSRPLHLLLAGSAGLARALADRMPGSASLIEICMGSRERKSAIVCVVGSFSRASSLQIDNVIAHDAAVIVRRSVSQWLTAAADSSATDILREAKAGIDKGRPLVFAAAGPALAPSRELVHAMARVLAPLLRGASTLVLTGGDTARSVLDVLGVRELAVLGEFEPGIAIARPRIASEPVVCIKAGGFGDPMALVRLLNFVEGLSSPSSTRATRVFPKPIHE